MTPNQKMTVEEFDRLLAERSLEAARKEVESRFASVSAWLVTEKTRDGEALSSVDSGLTDSFDNSVPTSSVLNECVDHLTKALAPKLEADARQRLLDRALETFNLEELL